MTAPRRLWRRPASATVAAAVAATVLASAPAVPRSLQAITDRGTLTLCASPDSLPWASKTGDLPGFQIELGEDLAARLGVSLTREWVLSAIQYRRAGCDVVFDAIVSQGAAVEGGLRLSKPYQRAGVMLAVPEPSKVAALGDLAPGQRVGVLVDSLASMTLGRRGVNTTPFVREGDLIAALADGEIDAAAVSPTPVGWYNKLHPQAPLRVVPMLAGDADFNWNLAIGMIGPDDGLRARVDAALAGMLADGTVARIYARYGVEWRPPE